MAALGSTLSTAEVLTEGLALPGSYSQRSTPAFATAYQPSTTRPVLVVASIEIAVNDNENGRIDVKVANANPPTVVIASHGGDHNNDAVGNAGLVTVRSTVSFIVPAGQRYQLDTATVAGAPAFTLSSVYELTL